MTINDLWHEVDIDHEAVALDRARTAARRALTPKVSFLMEASSREAFEDRMALIDDDISTIVRQAAGDGIAYGLTRTSVIEDLNEMFDRGETHRRRTEAARRARQRRSSTHHAATQAEVDSWLARMSPDFAQWAEPYAQRMVYGPTYNRSIATTLPDAAKAFNEGGFSSPSFRYFASMLDAALGSEKGEQWYMDSARGEYTQRLDGTIAAKTASFSSTAPASFVADFEKADQALQAGGWVKRDANGFEYVDPNAPPQLVHLYQSLFQMGYANGYFSGFGTEAAKTAKFVVRQRGTMSGGQNSYDTREEAQSKADALNTEHGTNDYIVSEEGDDKTAATITSVDEDDPVMEGAVFHTNKGDFTLIYYPRTPAEQAEMESDEGYEPWFAEEPGQRPPVRYRIIGPEGQEVTVFSASGDESLGPYYDAFDQARRIIEREGLKIASVTKNASRKLVDVTDAEVKKFVEAADRIGYTIDSDQAHDILMMNGGFKSAMESAGIWGDRYQEVNAEGGIDVDGAGGGISMLIETTDPSSWFHSYSYDEEYNPNPDPADYDKLKAKLRRQKNKDYCDQYKGYAMEREGAKHAQVEWTLAVDNGSSKTWVTGEGTPYEGRVSTTRNGIVGEYQARRAEGYESVLHAKKMIEEMIARDKAARMGARPMPYLWRSIDEIETTEIGHCALTAVPDLIGVAWAITSKDGATEYASGKSRTIESAKRAMLKRADIFGQDPDVVAGTNPPKKKKKVVDPNDPNAQDDPDAEDEVEDEDDPDAIEDDAEPQVDENGDPIVPEAPLDNGIEDQVETVDPMTLDVGDTLTVSYTMGTGETGEVEGVFVRLEDDIAFFSGPNGEFGVAERDGVWVDSEGNQFTFSFGSPDETGDTDPNADQGVPAAPDPAAPAQGPPVADAKDKGDTEYKADDGKKPKKDDGDDDDKSKPPWLKGKGSIEGAPMTGTLTIQPGGIYTMAPSNGTPITASSSVGYVITPPKQPIRSMAELVTTIGELAPHLGAEEIFGLAQEAMAASRRNAGR